MTDTTAGETPAEPVPPVPPAPEASAELDAARLEAAPVKPEAEARALPEIEYPIGPVRQGVLDHLLDSEGPQTVAQIIAGLGGNHTRNTVESAIKREFDVGRIERVGPGLYVLAKPKPAAPPRPAVAPDPPKSLDVGSDVPTTDEEWLAVVDAWDADPASWNREILGPCPSEAGSLVPLGVAFHFNEKLRKRKERRRHAEAAAAKQSAVDAELRDQLLAACNGNFTPGPGIQDIASIKAAMELVPLDIVLVAIRHNVCRLCCPVNPTLTSWRDPRLLKAIADEYCRSLIIPRLVDAWSKAVGTAPGKAVERAEASPATQPSPRARKRIHGATRERERPS
jgi:hypothetical protein